MKRPSLRQITLIAVCLIWLVYALTGTPAFATDSAERSFRDEIRAEVVTSSAHKRKFGLIKASFLEVEFDTYKKNGQEKEALVTRELLAEYSRRTNGEKSFVYVNELAKLAQAYEEFGHPIDAETIFRNALEVWTTVRHRCHTENEFNLNYQLAIVLDEQGRTAEARLIKRKLLSAPPFKCRNPVLEARRHEVAASYLESEGNSGNGTAELEAYVAVPGLDPTRKFSMLAYLASLYERDGSEALANEKYKKAIETFQTIDKKDRSPDRRLTLGQVYERTNQDEAAEREYTDIVVDNAITQSGSGFAECEALSRLAHIYANAHDNDDKAVRTSNLSLDCYDKPGKAYGVTRASLDAYLAHVDRLYAMGRYREAIPAAQEVSAFLERERDLSYRFEAASPGMGSLQRLVRQPGEDSREEEFFGGYEFMLHDIWLSKEQGSEGYPSAALVAAQDRFISPATVAMKQAAAARKAPSVDAARLTQAYQENILQVERIDQTYSQALDARASDETLREVDTEYRAATDALGRTEADLSRVYPGYMNLINPVPLSLDDVRARLEPDQAVVMILPNFSRQFVYVVTKAGGIDGTGLGWFLVDGGGDRTPKNVRTLLCQIDNLTCSGKAPAEDAFDLAAAYQLYADTIGPAEDQLRANGVKRLYVVTRGHLSRFPMSALVTAAPGPETTLATAKWLVDSYAITRLPSVSALPLLATSPPDTHSTGGFIGYGDPDLSAPHAEEIATNADRAAWFVDMPTTGPVANRSRLLSLVPLAGTADELRTINAAFHQAPEGHIYLGDDNTEASFRTNPALANARIVSIATHGLLPDPAAKLDEPALVFTPPIAPTKDDDGLLLASEVASVNLRADWVVLSACNTGTSPAAADSVSDLAKAFLFAGADSVLASHWRVDDEATALLTTTALTAYGAGDRGLTRAQALQAAEIILRDTPSGDYVHPRYWASFSIISNSDR